MVGILMGNGIAAGVVDFTYDPASIAANTTVEQTVTVLGLRIGDSVNVVKPSLTAGVGIVNARVSATNTLAITWCNCTAAPVDPASETYKVMYFRTEGGTGLPAAVS